MDQRCELPSEQVREKDEKKGRDTSTFEVERGATSRKQLSLEDVIHRKSGGGGSDSVDGRHEGCKEAHNQQTLYAHGYNFFHHDSPNQFGIGEAWLVD